MIKYIRAGNGIAEIDFSEKENRFCYFTTKGWIDKTKVTKESENLEDLFDAYVTYDVNNGYDFFTEKGWDETYPFEDDLKELKNNTLWVMNNRPDLEPALYGAIWTDKGLKYVAKINKNGEWELI